MRECERERDVKFTTLVNIIEMIAVRENKVEIDKVFFLHLLQNDTARPYMSAAKSKKRILES